MSDNIVLFYLFFIVVGFFTAMFGTIIGNIAIFCYV